MRGTTEEHPGLETVEQLFHETHVAVKQVRKQCP